MRIRIMKQQFLRPVLLCNDQSGSYDAALEAEIAGLLAEAGAPLVRRYGLPEDPLPTAEQLMADRADMLIVWTGDGTINAAAHLDALWDGALLVLPGGTLNLLSKSLHGDRDAVSILRDALAPTAKRQTIPILRYDGEKARRNALITILAGPATRWAEVRETMRQEGVLSASREAPEALEEMINGDSVRLAGSSIEFPAIILTPTPDGIEAHGILTDSSLDIIRHGLAWLSGDFRDGPSITLTKAREIVLESDAPIRLEFDGELTKVPSPARFSLAQSRIEFIATQ